MNVQLHDSVHLANADGALARLVARMRTEIPLAAAMDLRPGTHAHGMLSLHAPLAPNINDKGCAFGGSLASLLTLSGWALVELELEARGLHCEVFVQDSTLRYVAPVWGELHAIAHLDEGEHWDDFFAVLSARGKARVQIRASIESAGEPAALLQARYVARLPRST
jgi:thioesterase domain-containing protein